MSTYYPDFVHGRVKKSIPEVIKAIDRLVERVRQGGFREVIMGTTPNVEGDGTALVIAGRLAGLPIVITKLARGLTVGASLQQANREMLSDAISSRQKL